MRHKVCYHALTQIRRKGYLYDKSIIYHTKNKYLTPKVYSDNDRLLGQSNTLTLTPILKHRIKHFAQIYGCKESATSLLSFLVKEAFGHPIFNQVTCPN